MNRRLTVVVVILVLVAAAAGLWIALRPAHSPVPHLSSVTNTTGAASDKLLETQQPVPAKPAVETLPPDTPSVSRSSSSSKSSAAQLPPSSST